MRAPAALVALAIGLSAGCGSDENEVHVLDEDAGAFRGVTVGKPPPDQLDQVFGAPCENPDNLAPCGEDATKVTAMQSLPGEWGTDNREDVTLLSDNHQVKALLITSGVETMRGVGIGDDLDSVSDAYPGATCDVQQFEDSGGDPYCTVDLPSGLRLQFGGDPINSIAIGTRAFT